MISTGSGLVGRSGSVVALGGGHGLASTLKAARLYAQRISAVVSLGDDGGSSGKLRAEYEIPPPGDVRRCLSALAGDNSLLAASLEHRRFDGALSGHPVGNLLLSGLTLAGGDFQAAVDEVARLVGAVGRIFPATLAPVTLLADSDSGLICSQVEIDEADGVRDLRFEPADPAVSELALTAIAEADQVVLGPGSFFTSVLAAASVPGIRKALAQTDAQQVFVANISCTSAEVSRHLEKLPEYGLSADVVIVDQSLGIATKSDIALNSNIEVMSVDVASNGWSHDPVRLATALKAARTPNL